MAVIVTLACIRQATGHPYHAGSRVTPQKVEREQKLASHKSASGS